MKRWRRDVIKKEKAFQRNVWIALALLLVAFLAKMEAINFLLAFAAGIIAGMYVFKLQRNLFNNADDANEQLSSGFFRFIISTMFWHGKLEQQLILPVVSGFLSGLLIYSALNYLFVAP